ncbi:hypothetical protein KP509_30G041300 [Ceratopteris richardii]|uniref:Phosphatidate cytidylyltransferase, mitochondrial n=1 Tax=Ceratopteris richardii TaxID=49495 RepID=A0A8T2R1Y2_CERRI|nr:hypothetical protein KP509_30G041300 [Ceratopteris richardii]
MHARGSLVSHFQVQRSRAFGSCHAMATDVKEALAAPLQDLPAVDFAFAYGSGVFQQPGNLILSRNEAPMVDYILGVQMPTRWHSENIERNPHHYNSWLSWFGGKGVSYVAEKVGAGVHFNAFVPWKDKMIKYGVIGMGDLAEDLLTWKSLYISGRLQKPVRFLVDNWDMAKVNQVNLHAAASTALLLLPSQFSEEDFYAKICGLSYMGDIRMLFAEDKNKVQRIVKGSSKHFHRLYRAPLFHMAAEGILELPRTFGDVRSLIKRVGFFEDCSPYATKSLVRSLPETILQKMFPYVRIRHNSELLLSSGEASEHVQRAIRSIVRSSSTKQMLSGLLAAGALNSLQYVWKKTMKALRSRAPRKSD